VFCTGGWIDPRVIPSRGSVAPAGSAVLRPLERIARFATRLPASVQARRIQRRWDHVRRLSSAIDLFISPSSYLREEFIRFGFPPERVQYCDYGFTTTGFSKRADLPTHARRFAFIGSLVPHKGVHVLLRAFASMPEDARLDVCGSPDSDPSYSQSLQQAARHPGIRFMGGLSPERVAGFLQTVDCQVVPSIWNENSPLTIHEAFLSGVPVVASRMGGSSGLLAEGGGLLYDADDPADLQRQLMRLYEEPNLMRRLAATAPAVKTMDDHVAELVPIYERLCKESSSRHARR
jgi:glycosyltransferase involved in cell wall biosynthesis